MFCKFSPDWGEFANIQNKRYLLLLKRIEERDFGVGLISRRARFLSDIFGLSDKNTHCRLQEKMFDK